MKAGSKLKGRRVLVTGAEGFIGRNLVPMIRNTGCILTAVGRKDGDLLEQAEVRRLMREVRPEVVFHLAGLIGGIMANKLRPADFCYENLLMNTVVMHESWRAKVDKYITLMGGCSYPGTAPNPIPEEELWNGYPQAESAPYSVGKRMNVVMADAYRRQYGFNAVVLMPGNVYGPHDDFDLNNSHVIPALIRKFSEAVRDGKGEVGAWGTGRPVRDFVYIEDVCEAVLLGADSYDASEIVNISSGVPTTIRELTELVAELSGFSGRIVWDDSKPDGQMLKGYDVRRMKERLRFTPKIPLRLGLEKTIAWYRASLMAIKPQA